MEFFISLTIPENMNALSGTIKTQNTSFEGMVKLKSTVIPFFYKY